MWRKMATHFVFPENLGALEEEEGENRLYAQNLIDIATLCPSELEEFVKGVSFDLSDKELSCIGEQDLFDRVYSLIRGFLSLTPSCKFNLVETLRSNLGLLLPNVDSLSPVSQGQQEDDDAPVLDLLTTFKIYTFFLLNIVLAEESNISCNNNSKVTATTRKKQLTNSWNWEPQRGQILNLIANSLEINLALLFGSSDLDENYLFFITKNAYSMFENAALLKDSDAKGALCRIIGACATKYHYIAQSCASIVHLIHRYHFVVTHMADAVAGAEKKYADGTLASSLIREIGRTNPKYYAKDTVEAENIGCFLVELADRLPELISTIIEVLLPSFGGESYKIRNALVGVLGKLVAKAFTDVEGGVSSKSVRVRTKQAMLEILLERCRDVSEYTRSQTLEAWAELCEQHSVSIGLWNEVAAVAAGRLVDKSTIARKSALNLLMIMLQHNPFGPQLRIASFEATLEHYKKKLNELEPDIKSKSVTDGIPSDNDTCGGDSDTDNVNDEWEAKEEQGSLADSSLIHMEEGIAQKDGSVPDVGNLKQTRALVASLEAGLRFSKCISATMPTLIQLMASSSATDVENTIHLLMRCKQFQIDGAETCLRKMLPLVFSQDKSVYEAVENAFIAIYIGKSPVETAKNLLNLAIDSNIGDQASLEYIVGALVFKGDISTSMISALWDFFCFNASGTTAKQSRGALSVLCMAAKSSSWVLGSHLQEIIDIGFGHWAKVEPLLARTACIAIQRLSEEDKKKLLLNNGSRVFGILESLIAGSWLPYNIWYAAAEKAVGAIYTIHPTPEILAADLVKKSFSSIFDCTGGDELQNDIDSGTVSILTTVQLTKLSRYLLVVSHVAMNQLVYIESRVREIQKQKGMKKKLAADNQNVHSNCTTADTPKDNSINAELGLATSEDAKLDTLFEGTEKEIVPGGSGEKNLVGQSASFLSKLCSNFGLMQKYPELQASAVLALCRLMVLDANYCDANLQLLLTVVENAPSEIVRSYCTIALGKLAVYFPNLLEPWTENMYTRLRDPSVCVRKNAVMVISHLILNDVMKVKGHMTHINEMAIRVEDDDDRISNLARIFFHELSKKGSNPIYNLLPDILGKLSNQNLKRESFCNIMQFLIGLIKKEKQMDTLVEKLCNRFSGFTDIRQWEYISYCLSQLTVTEKGMKKFIELFNTYEHALSEDSVMDHFRKMINKGKKSAKRELKVCIEEFEEKLNKFHLEKKDQEVMARNTQIHRQKVSSMEGFVVARNAGEESAESDIAKEVGEYSENPKSETSKPNEKDYIVYMGDIPEEAYCTKTHHLYVLSTVVGSAASKSLINSFDPLFNGFVARITHEQAEKLAGMEEVVSVFPNQKLRHCTTKAWKSVGLPINALMEENQSNIVVGIIDSGIWSDSAAFSDKNFGDPPRKWRGGIRVKDLKEYKKIVGARVYPGPENAEKIEDEFLSIQDWDGHGTSCSFIVAGNQVRASFYGFREGVAQGGMPSSRISMYKVDWPPWCETENNVLTTQGNPLPELDTTRYLKAMRDAVSDGVDIISVSLGVFHLDPETGVQFRMNYLTDPLAIGAFHAMTKGVLTVFAAGNLGSKDQDYRRGSVVNHAPWGFCVGAATSDELFITKVLLGDGYCIKGHSLNIFEDTGMCTLVRDVDVVTEIQDPESGEPLILIKEDKVKDKIIFCQYETLGNNYAESDAKGIIIEFDDIRDEHTVRVFPLPAVYVSSEDGQKILEYIEMTSNKDLITASIYKSVEVRNPKAGTVAEFSGRGPNPITPDVLKPDIMAPGVGILTLTLEDSFQIVWGTSVAAPFVASGAAYIKSIHPDWSPAVIKSAIMTTATLMAKILGAENEFAYGAGFLNIEKALDPGLVFDIAPEDYVKHLSTYYKAKELRHIYKGYEIPAKIEERVHLNLPTMTAAVSPRIPKCEFHRVVRNVGPPSDYVAYFDCPSSIKMMVSPNTLMFLGDGQELSFKVKIQVISFKDFKDNVFSTALTWQDGKHDVRSPILLRKSM